jgi:hypothetical protein
VYNFKNFKRSLEDLEDLEKNIFNFKIFNQEEESIAINIVMKIYIQKNICVFLLSIKKIVVVEAVKLYLNVIS